MADYPVYRGLITRKRELHEIYAELRKQSRLILIASGGMGKTALISNFIEQYDNKYGRVNYLSGYDFENRKDIDLLIRESKNFKSSLLIIDDFDEILTQEAKEKVLQIFKEKTKNGLQILLSSRNTTDLVAFEKYANIYRLGPLSAKEAQDFFHELLIQQGIPVEQSILFEKIIKESNYSPLVIQQIAELLKYTNPEDIIKGLSTKINYKNDLISQFIEPKQIILPEQKKLITDVSIVNGALLKLAKNDPEVMFKISPRDFEILIAELFDNEGYEVELTPETRDGGKDIIVVNNNSLGKFLIYVECKQHSPDRPVSVNVVQKLHGAVTIDNATSGIVVTSSYFSKPAISLTEKIKHKMSLVDFVELSNRIKSANLNS